MAKIRNLKKVLSIVLAVSLCMSMVSMVSFADDEQPERELVCTQEESEGHHHTDECYTRILICGQEEHTHAYPACYEDVNDPGFLSAEPLCGQDEHTHTDDCYAQELTCGLEEGEGAHTHTDECYAPVEESGEGETGEEKATEPETTETGTTETETTEPETTETGTDTEVTEPENTEIPEGAPAAEEPGAEDQDGEAEQTEESLTYTFEDGVLTITGPGTVTEDFINEFVEGNTVKYKKPVVNELVVIGEVYFEKTKENRSPFWTIHDKLTSLDLSQLTSTVIDDYAFSSLLIKECKLPASVKTYGAWSMTGLSYLTTGSIELDGVTIGDHAFYALGNNSPDSYVTLTLTNCDIGFDAFGFCNVDSLTVDGGTIGQSAFFCSWIDDASISDATIEQYAFRTTAPADGGSYGTYDSITLDNCTLNQYAFNSAEAEEITINNCNVQKWAFYSAKADTLTINGGEFAAQTLQKTEIPNVTVGGNAKFGDYTFYLATGLKTLTIDGPAEFGNNFCNGVNSLETVNITEKAEGVKIPAKMFMNITSLTTVTGSEYASFIGAHAFSGCTGLTELKVADDAVLEYSNIFPKFENLKDRMEAILAGKFALDPVPAADELTVSSSWTSSHAGTGNNTDADGNQVTKAARWAGDTTAQVQFQFAHATNPGMDFLFILDFSDSMTQVGSGNGSDSRFYDMQSKVIDTVLGENGLLNGSYNNQVGIITFGGKYDSTPSSLDTVSFTSDKNALSDFINNVKPYYEATDYLKALNAAKDMAAGRNDSSRQLAIVFISDGRPNCNDGKEDWKTKDSCVEIADELRADGAKIFGVLQCVPDKEITDAENVIKAMSDEGLYFTASDTEQFSQCVNNAIGACYEVYTLVDTVAPEYTLVDGSIQVDVGEYEVSEDADGNTVITWTITGVPFVTHTMTYQVTANGYGTYDTNEGDALVYMGTQVGENEQSVNSVATPTLTRTAPSTPPTGGGGGGDTTTPRYDLTVEYVDVDGNTLRDSNTTRHSEGYNYTVTVPAIEGYTYTDNATLTGTLNSDTTVTLVYAADEDIPEEQPPLSDEPTTDIPDENPPLADAPTTDIPDENPPLADAPQANVPKTGDNSLFWIMTAALSAAGLIWLSTGKRKEEQ